MCPFVVDVFAQKIDGWNVAIRDAVELVELPVRMVLWQRANDGAPVHCAKLLAHPGADGEYTSLRFSEHLTFEGVGPLSGPLATCMTTPQWIR